MSGLTRLLGLVKQPLALSGPGAPASAAEPASAPPPPRGGAAKRYKISTAIPTGALITGDLALHESCIIGGTIEGRLLVLGKGMAAFIKAGAVIRGGIKADIVIVYGEVTGPIEATYVHIHPGGAVRGPVSAQSMRVEQGALYSCAGALIAPGVDEGQGGNPADPIDAAAMDIETRPAPPPPPPAPPAQRQEMRGSVTPIRRPTSPDELRAALARMRTESFG